jgi:isopentenyl diphosphate isomerase/L-lactate dehydrogenase-like FMN-dependent dehydrogenase
VESPVGIAPSAFHGLAHADAERATARAAAAHGSLMTLSTFANTAVEEIARIAAPRLWFQLYLSKDRELSRALVQRAFAAGARALVVTVDAPYLGRREANERHAFRLPDHLSVPNVGTLEGMEAEGASGSQLTRHFQTRIDPSFTWNDLAWLRELTPLPIVVKGVLTAEDAHLAAERGVHVWVSNHGGRQLDTAVSSIEALPEVVEAVAGRVEVYLDGGVTRGTDVVKALALGARAVFLGRAPLWGLAAGGEAGVRRTLTLLQDEVRLAMALCGAQNVAQLTPNLIRR